ncbi:type IX secretion system plug protein domain-containing protein [Balneola vulgaris]|uniref:type IX secretion system plug protein n=1 Tax=Balneola vulgaris TaxID=287535 RepID=UPI00037C537E|nr:type IX secretion system plug protein domain-containing protein [Balneola vulgaris]
MSNRHSYLWVLLLCLSFTLIQCSSSAELSTIEVVPQASNRLASVKSQVLPPSSIQSITFSSSYKSDAPPILHLGSSDQLHLEFDELTDVSGQFRVQFKHYNKDWTPSNLPDAWIMDGFNEFIINGGTSNSLSDPKYYHYKESFNAKELDLLVSGNYMLEVYDFSTNTLLFSLPFLVTEQEGKLQSNIETVYNGVEGGAHGHQIFNSYTYPSEIEFPQFELSFTYIPRRFLGLATSTDIKNIGNNREINFHLSRQKVFDASYDFALLDLSNFAINATQIDEWIPEANPARVILKPDQLNFISGVNSEMHSRTIGPLNARNARYAEVIFRLEADALNSTDEIVVLGDFNNWTYDERLKLSYNQSSRYLEGSALIKQGTYRYKYFRVIKKGTNSYLLPINDRLSARPQIYHTVVYYRDPVKNFDRILMIGSVEANR